MKKPKNSKAPVDRFLSQQKNGWTRYIPYGVLLAVSGGADSTALLRLFMEIAGENTDALAVAHVNHRMRGDESEADADFVRKLAEEYRLRYCERRFEPVDWNLDDSGSVEAAARKIRYDFFRETAETLGFRYVAVAHTADDQVETVLHRIVRGTGIGGLAGIPAVRQLSPAVSLIRPLLETPRHEIHDYLQRIGQPFRTDSSNADDDFTRNKIRNKLLPFLRNEFNPGVDAALLRLAAIAGETDEALDEILDAAVSDDAPERIDVALLRLPKPLVRAFFVRLWKKHGGPLRDMGSDQWNALLEFLKRDTGSRMFPGGVIVEKTTERICVRFKDVARSTGSVGT